MATIDSSLETKHVLIDGDPRPLRLPLWYIESLIARGRLVEEVGDARANG